MSWVGNIFKKRSAVISTSASPVWSPLSMGNWAGSMYDRSFERLCNEGFRNNIIVHRCMWVVATNLQKFPLVVKKNNDGEEVERHPALAILKHPSPQQTATEFGIFTIYSLNLCGSAYILKERNTGGKVIRLRVLNPNYFLQHNPASAEQMEKGYTIGSYRFAVQLADGGSAIQDIPANDIIHIRLPDPLNPLGGLSPLVAAYSSLRSDNEASEYTYYTFKNRGKNPSTIMKTIGNLGDDGIKRVKAGWDAAFGGSNRGGVAVLPEEISGIETISMTMKDLEFPELRGMDEARLCMAFGVPPILVGAKIGLESTADSNVEQQNLLFYENTIDPYLTLLDDVWDTYLMPEFDKECHFEYDRSNSPTMMRISEKANQARLDQVKSGLITLNEWRSMNGWTPDTKGDYYLRPMGQIAVYINNDPDAWLKELSTPPASSERSLCSCGHNHTRDLKQVVRKRYSDKEYARRLRVAGVRMATSLGWIKTIRNWAEGELEKQYSDILAIVDSQENKQRSTPDTEDQLDMFAKLGVAAQRWTERIYVTTSDSWIKDIFARAGVQAIEEIGIDVAFDIQSPATIEYVQRYSYHFAKRISDSTAEQVRELFEKSVTDGMSYDDMRASLKVINQSWSDSRVDMIARTESLRAANNGAQEGYRQAGVTRKVWSAVLGDACEECVALDGTTVGIEESFIPIGGEMPVTGRVNTYEAIDCGNAHPGCECVILAQFDEGE